MIPTVCPNSEPVIQAKDLYYIYPRAEKPALDGLCATVNHGEIFGLLGPNGAGKTTALSLLATILRPQKGHLFLCGMDASRQPRSIRTVIGLIPQELALYPAFTLKENLAFFGRLCGLRSHRLTNRIADCLDMVGLTSHGNSQVKHVSGGMKRRCNIAIALMNDPRVLLLDEPTVGVDIHTRKLIFNHLLDLKASGMTMIYTTHYMEDAEHLCDRIIIMDEGKDVAQGSSEELIKGTGGCNNLEDVFLCLTGKQIRKQRMAGFT